MSYRWNGEERRRRERRRPVYDRKPGMLRSLDPVGCLMVVAFVATVWGGLALLVWFLN